MTWQKKENFYFGKIDGKIQFEQKQYLLLNLSNILGILKGNDCDHTTFMSIFHKPIKFYQMYNFIKGHKENVYNKDIPQ